MNFKFENNLTVRLVVFLKNYFLISSDLINSALDVSDRIAVLIITSFSILEINYYLRSCQPQEVFLNFL